MQAFEETLDRIARSGQAVFAIDGADRIILWNKSCETLLGLPARRALGKPCYEVLCGKDTNDNLYCHRNCPVAYQARQTKDDPVNRFTMTVKTGDGKRKKVSSSLFSIPSYHPALTTVVHVLRPETAAMAAAGEPEPLTPIENAEGEVIALTAREKEILRCLAQGMSTPAVAKKLSIARVTVRNHVQNILQKLNVHSKLEAVVLAHKHQLI
jgi:PAS domain S-box-containing protein